MIFGLVGWVVGERKGRPEAGFIFGALLGPIDWLIVAVGPDVRAAKEAKSMRKCPYCAELVQPDAKLCKHCGKSITPVFQSGADSTIQEYERWKKTKDSVES